MATSFYNDIVERYGGDEFALVFLKYSMLLKWNKRLNSNPTKMWLYRQWLKPNIYDEVLALFMSVRVSSISAKS